jgi:PPP family 3-phenylpropionic acid transporter
MSKINDSKYYITFILLYSFSYMCNAVYSIFIPVYLDSIGYSKTNIGILLSLAPVVAILGQPIWGTFTDRSKNKNTVLKILIGGSALSVLLYKISTDFFYLSCIITCFTFFQTSINPLSDAITLEYSQETKWKFGHIRLAGTLGYSIMAVVAGNLLIKDLDNMFILYFLLGCLTFITTLFIPKIKGHQAGKKKLAPWQLFKDKKLIMYLMFALVIQITLGFYNTFFSIYYQQLGANRSLIGWSSFISGISEIPFLFFAHIILKKLKTPLALLIAGFAAGLRWLILGISADIYVILIFQLIHGLIYIVISVSLATYINESVPKELKATGQALNALFGTGVARVIGSLFGGYLSDLFGIRNMFIYNSIIAFIAVIVFALLLYKQKSKETASL